MDFDGTCDLDLGLRQVLLGLVQIVRISWEVFRISPQRSRHRAGIAHGSPLHDVIDEALVVKGVAEGLTHVEVREGCAPIVHADEKESIDS